MNFELFDFAVEEADGAFGLSSQPTILELMEAGLLLSPLGNEMGVLGQEGTQALLMSGLGSIRRGSIGLAISAEDAGIDPIGFGEDVARAGKVANLTWVDDAERNMMGVEKVDETVLITAGSLANHMKDLRGFGFDPVDEIGEARGIVGDGEGLLAPAAVDSRFGNIGSEIDTSGKHEIMSEGWRRRFGSAL